MIDEKFGQETTIPGFEVPLFQSPGSGELDASEVGITPDEIAPMLESAKTEAAPEPAAKEEQAELPTEEPEQEEEEPSQPDNAEEADDSPEWEPGNRSKRR